MQVLRGLKERVPGRFGFRVGLNHPHRDLEWLEVAGGSARLGLDGLPLLLAIR
jgi:hypothetical protein